MISGVAEKAARRATLLVVDMQNDMCHPEGALARFGLSLAPIVPLIVGLPPIIDRARSAGVRIAFTIHENSADTVSPMRREKHRDRGTDQEEVCAVGSWGARLHESFTPHEEDLRIVKHRYSAFVGTNFELLLRNLGIETIIVTGMNTNVCVESTVRDAFMRDYHVIIPRDGVASVDPDLHEPSLRNFALYFGDLTTLAELSALWGGVPARAVR